MKTKIVLRIIAILIVVLSVLPYVPLDYWWIRSFDFPHLQLTFLSLIIIAFYLFKFSKKVRIDYFFIAVLLLCIFFQGSKIYPYTFLAPVEVSKSDSNSREANVSVYTANVLQENKERDKIVQSIDKRNPDIILLTETHNEWRNYILDKFAEKYPYTEIAPFENTYGMMLLSKYKLHDSHITFLVEDTIPSIQAKIILPSKDTIQLIAIHPTPPVPMENPTSADRDAELMKVAFIVKKTKLPVIVMGDFNDVAWSETTELFQEVSGLLDMRKGRGLYNTYNANIPVLRWPLDHIFISPGFEVLHIEKGEHIGSDHFPFYTKVHYNPKNIQKQKLPSPDEDEIEEAVDQIENEEEEEKQQEQEQQEEEVKKR